MIDVTIRLLAALERHIALSGTMGEYKTLERYRSRLWSAMVRLYNGGRDANFVATFARSIDQQLTDAWNEGADSVGVKPDEMSKEDMLILDGIIRNENDFITRIAGEIQGDKDAGMERDKFDTKYGARVDLWANRYTETQNRAKIVFGGKTKLEWKLGATEKHCPFCKKLSGIVAYATEWDQSRIHPQMPPNPILSGEVNGEKGCAGWGCDCSLEPTTKRRTGRALDRLTQIATDPHL